jgi:hypothetical protein
MYHDTMGLVTGVQLIGGLGQLWGFLLHEKGISSFLL